jgi:hypothetical protein
MIIYWTSHITARTHAKIEKEFTSLRTYEPEKIDYINPQFYNKQSRHNIGYDRCPAHKDYLKNQEPEKIIENLNTHPIKETKLYWLLSRCLVKEPKNRSILLI